MKIRINSNFDPGASELELPGTGPTLRMVLEELSRRNWRKIRFIDPKTGALDDFFVVYLNGQNSHSLPDGIDTSLQEKDIVQLDMITFMGGS